MGANLPELLPYKHSEVAKWERRILGSSSEEVQDDILRHLKIADCNVDVPKGENYAAPSTALS